MARVIQEQVKKPLAEEVLFGKLTKGGTVRILLKGDALHFEYLGRNEEKSLPKMPERKALPRAKAVKPVVKPSATIKKAAKRKPKDKVG